VMSGHLSFEYYKYISHLTLKLRKLKWILGANKTTIRN